MHTHDIKPKTNFLSLPAEIRQKIYLLALFSPSDSTNLSQSQSTHRLYTWIDIRLFHNNQPSRLAYSAPALLSASRLIRWEASPLYYTRIQFRFTESSAAVRWLESLERDNRRDLRDVVYCPNYLTWMDPRRVPIPGEVLGREWREVCDVMRRLEMDVNGLLRVCGYGGGRGGWVFAKGVGFEGEDGDGNSDGAEGAGVRL